MIKNKLFVSFISFIDNIFFRIFPFEPKANIYANGVLYNKFIGLYPALYRILIYLNSTQKIKFKLYWWFW